MAAQETRSCPSKDHPVVAAAIALARDIAITGLGEGEKAHGVAIAVCDGARMMEREGDGTPLFGEPNDSNTLFTHKKIKVIGLTGTEKREVLNEFQKDGMVLIDKGTSCFVASNYMVGDIRRGDKSGGARHKSASAMGQFDGGSNAVLKVGEAECKASKGNMDLFLGTKLPERLPIVLADEMGNAGMGGAAAEEMEEMRRQMQALQALSAAEPPAAEPEPESESISEKLTALRGQLEQEKQKKKKDFARMKDLKAQVEALEPLEKVIPIAQGWLEKSTELDQYDAAEKYQAIVEALKNGDIGPFKAELRAAKAATQVTVKQAQEWAKAGEWTHCCKCGHKLGCGTQFMRVYKCGESTYGRYKGCCKCSTTIDKDGKE